MRTRKLLPCGSTKADLAKDLRRLEKLIEITKAAMAGAEVEFRNWYGVWTPDMEFCPVKDIEYRVKPIRKKKASSHE